MRALTLSAVLLMATAAYAHNGVKNPAVMARMEGMSKIVASMRVLGGMAQQKLAFDQATAQQAARDMAAEAAKITALFEANEDDPKSEAREEIWQDYADFTAKADALTEAANAATNVTSLQELWGVVGPIGDACKDCHKTYRE